MCKLFSVDFLRVGFLASVAETTSINQCELRHPSKHFNINIMDIVLGRENGWRLKGRCFESNLFSSQFSLTRPIWKYSVSKPTSETILASICDNVFIIWSGSFKVNIKFKIECVGCIEVMSCILITFLDQLSKSWLSGSGDGLRTLSSDI